ncbi:MAG: aryl-sulfate sulfotransferase [Planctomycetota bacterium]
MTRAACLLFPVALAAFSAPPRAQTAADGLRIYEPVRQGVVRMVDTNGAVVHEWATMGNRNGGMGLHVDGTLYRGVQAPPTGAVQKVGLDGKMQWLYYSPAGLRTHHDIEVLPNGNVLMIAMELKSSAEAIAEGRDPATVPGILEPDAIIEIKPTGDRTGDVVWQWHIWDHLVQDFDPTKQNFGVVGDHPELVDVNYPRSLFLGSEFNHMNGIDYDPVHDWIVMSSPLHDEIWIIDHSTTTAEAAGHTGGRWGKGGDLLYRWGNPQVYDAGAPSAVQLDFQHDPQFIPPGYPGAGNLTVFSNNPTSGISEVVEIVLPVDGTGQFMLTPGGAYGPAAPVWSYSDPGFYSQIMSSAERLPNGNTLICSGRQGHVFEVTSSGQTVWETFETVGTASLFQAHFVKRSLWADNESMSASSGGSVQFDLFAGSPRAGHIFLMMGSASGTAPGFLYRGATIPLNPDGYLSGVLSSLGRGAFVDWVGVTDTVGTARATFTLPPLPFLVGLQLDHAMITADPVVRNVTLATNPVPLVFAP